MAAFANVLAPYPPDLTNNAAFLRPPVWQAGGSSAYLLGTDAIGRDILSRLIYGARLSLLIGIAVVALSIVVGIALGLIAGFARGVTEIAIMRLMDIILTLPSLLLAIVIVAILGPGIMNAMLAVAVVVLPHYVRITRAAVISETAKDYVTAARANGAGRLRLMFNEVLPNCAAPLIVQASLGVSVAILDAAALGFLGPGRATPRLRMGNDAGRRARVRAARMVGRDVSGDHDPDDRARLQPAGRRAARRARSEAQALIAAMALLEIEDLHVEFPSQGAVMHAVEGVSLALDEGEVLGIVGESGSGKSVTMLAVMGLTAYPGRVRAQAAAVRRPRSAATVRPRAPDAHRQGRRDDLPGSDDEPQPVLYRSASSFARRCGCIWKLDAKAARHRAIELLEQVGIPAASSRLGDFPHQLSGGMNQRVMIAMAIACNPRLLIADEPTTALDVTIQAQILDLLRGLQRERGMALILVTHNMGVVAEMARRVIVMYAGEVVEERRADALFAAPEHPYTAALLAAMPERSTGETRLATIPGVVPGSTIGRRAACSRRAAAMSPGSRVERGRSSAPGPTAGFAATSRSPIRERDAAIARDAVSVQSTP